MTSLMGTIIPNLYQERNSLLGAERMIKVLSILVKVTWEKFVYSSEPLSHHTLLLYLWHD